MKMQNFKYDFLTYAQDDYVKSDCADITFYNQGGTFATINAALRLAPGQSISLTANANEMDTTIYKFQFSGAGSKQLLVIRKIYI